MKQEQEETRKALRALATIVLGLEQRVEDLEHEVRMLRIEKEEQKAKRNDDSTTN
jgi:hypothetical protein